MSSSSDRDARTVPASGVHLPRMFRWQAEEIFFFLDPESPHWIATDARAARIIGWLEEGLTGEPLLHRYAQAEGLAVEKAWLHLHDFTGALLRCGFAQTQPAQPKPYLGRAAYAAAGALRELWLHTNNICNLSCTHCLVDSAPWVKDWGLPTPQIPELVDEAAALGADRFYLTGGEPFMRKDLGRILSHITERRKAEAIVLTNAMLLKGERGGELKRLPRERLRFQVSLDGATPATNDRIRGVGSFERTLEGLRWLNAHGFETSLTTVVTRANLQELPGLARLCRQAGGRVQHLMWAHRRGRILSGTAADDFPTAEELAAAVRRVRRVAEEEGVALDNWETVKQRVNGPPGVKYDLGNACWDSLCIYSDGTVYPSAALANFPPLALGSLQGSGREPGRKPDRLAEIWQNSPVARTFRRMSLVDKQTLAEDPFRFLTGGGDIEHSFWFNLNGESPAAPIAPERLRRILAGPDPYHPLYVALMKDAMAEIARRQRDSINRRSGYDVPRILHAMGQGAIHCATEDLAVTEEVDVRTLHSNCVLAFDVDKPRRLVREYYGKAALKPVAELCCPTKFDPSLVGHIPQEVVDRFYGCGSPVTLAGLRPGETLVDLGSGAGIDCFIAAKLAGPTGKAIGIDMTDEMLKVANANRPVVAANLGYDVVEFRSGYLEQVPVESKFADVVTSNCVVNLSPDKPKVFAEIWRILKDNGRMVVADIVSDRPVPARLKVNPQLWGECTVGALTEAEFLAGLEEAGFYGLSVLKKSYWKAIEGYDFYSVTVLGFKFEKTSGCRFIGQRAIYLGPFKSAMDEEGHLFPRNEPVEVCTDTAAKLAKPPYAGRFIVIASPGPSAVAGPEGAKQSACGPGCC